eukprot:10404692-Alexandrium_andersonii.AAC.1
MPHVDGTPKQSKVRLALFPARCPHDARHDAPPRCPPRRSWICWFWSMRGCFLGHCAQKAGTLRARAYLMLIQDDCGAW